ncbi:MULTISPECIES: hypothetical protein [unclassified Leifsonia]|uniref:hypothetical protein n=1 Tax=unclassified Leifsonia TaxID=2663824 RepID=UPI0006FC34F4|nr:MULTISPECIES: hypothetical protein [unclassified Leifsonia]KQX06447.1 hypothetical protein ASC59_00775 [Leifsonia sp. Root1293]KRA10730.1 hypothetical protein ASD61_00775 [Leifsonia sp. Root60]
MGVAATRAGSRSFWIDPRFIVGLVLVLGSVIGVYAVIAAADRTTEVYVARDALVVGQAVDADDLVITSVRLGDGADVYLAATAPPADGLVMTRSVLAGEMIPASAVSTTTQAGLTSVVVTVSGRLPESVATGSVVDLWAARASKADGFDPPVVLVPGATVAAVREADGFLADGDGRAVELLVPRDDIALVLEAIADDDALSVVPGDG